MSEIKVTKDWNKVAEMYRKTIEHQKERDPNTAERFEKKLKQLKESGKI